MFTWCHRIRRSRQVWPVLARHRAPLLFIAFGEDHIVPPKASRRNEEKYDDSVSITEFTQFPGRPHVPGAPGWEEVADYALRWAVEHASRPAR